MDTRARLLASGARLIAERGFGGASVRAICADANASANQIHHCFGSKQGLLDAIVEQYGANVFAVSSKLLRTPPRSREDFGARIVLLFETTLDAYADNRDLMMVVLREGGNPPALAAYMALFAAFVDQGKELGFARSELDSEMLTGAMLDRVMNQVQFAPWIEEHYGASMADPEYRRRWCASNVDLFLWGMMAPAGAPTQTNRQPKPQAPTQSAPTRQF